MLLLVLAGLWLQTYLTQRDLSSEVTSLLGSLTETAKQSTAEDFAEYIDKAKGGYPNLVILLAQRTRVRTLSGKDQSHTRWRAGTLRYVEWPVVPPAAELRNVGGAPGEAEGPYESGWITLTAYRGSQDVKLAPVRIKARYAYFPERPETGQPGLLLIVGRDKATSDANMLHTYVLSVEVLLFAATVVCVSGILTARFVVRRLDAISATATDIVAGDLSRRVPVGKDDNEFDRLSDTLNSMFDRIERLLAGMREVSDNIAHDLRTPLFRLRSRVELALLDVDNQASRASARDALEVSLVEADRLLATFNALMSIAQLEAGAMREHMRPADISEILRDVAELYGPAAEERGLRIALAPAPPLIVNCHRELLVQAFSNLVDNALKYSPPGTTVTLAARTIQPLKGQERAVEISVVDEGPGIDREDRARVLKRFVRLEREHGAPGSGLGLSLVAAIAQVHSATFTLEDGPNGHGLAARFVMPAAA